MASLAIAFMNFDLMYLRPEEKTKANMMWAATFRFSELATRSFSIACFGNIMRPVHASVYGLSQHELFYWLCFELVVWTVVSYQWASRQGRSGSELLMGIVMLSPALMTGGWTKSDHHNDWLLSVQYPVRIALLLAFASLTSALHWQCFCDWFAKHELY